MKKSLYHALEAAAIALLAQAPAIAASPAVQDFIGKHPADAAIVPVAVGVLSAVYRWARAKWGKKAAAPVAAKPAA